MKQNFTVRRGALDGVETCLSVARKAAAELGVTARRSARRHARMQLPADGFIAACFPHKIKGGRPGLGQWPCSIWVVTQPVELAFRPKDQMRSREVVALRLATLLPIEGPLRINNGFGGSTGT